MTIQLRKIFIVFWVANISVAFDEIINSIFQIKTNLQTFLQNKDHWLSFIIMTISAFLLV